MKKSIVEIRNVNKSFDDELALSDISFDIYEGEFLTFLGASGCGKSTLLRLISGFEELTSGSIFINGKDVKHVPPHKRHVNMVFQSYALFPHMTVFENVAFGLRCKQVSEQEIKNRVNRVLQIVQLDQLSYRKPHQLSGGQQQRVAIARAVVNEPLVLLLDEPLSALDYSLRKSMQLELKMLQRRLGITFVFVTHNQEEALSISDRVVVMTKGKVAQIGTPREIYEKPSSLYVARFVGEANIFDTEVMAIKNGHIQVKVEDKLFTLANTRNFEINQPIAVVVRPEDLQAWDNLEVAGDDTSNMMMAVVEEVIYKGLTVDLILRTPSGKRLSATEFFDEDDEILDFKIGETVWVEWPLGWEVVLPRNEG